MWRVHSVHVWPLLSHTFLSFVVRFVFSPPFPFPLLTSIYTRLLGRLYKLMAEHWLGGGVHNTCKYLNKRISLLSWKLIKKSKRLWSTKSWRESVFAQIYLHIFYTYYIISLLFSNAMFYYFYHSGYVHHWDSLSLAVFTLDFFIYSNVF